jgi:hypothetical protein
MNILIVNYVISLIYLLPLLSNTFYINNILPNLNFLDKTILMNHYNKIRVLSIISILIPGVPFACLFNSIYNIIMKNVG